MTHLNHWPVKLVLFGSTVTTLDDTSSTIDIFVRFTSDEGTPLETFKYALINQVSLGITNVKAGSCHTLKRMNCVMNDVLVCFFFDEECLNRTAYLVAAMKANKWIIPALRVILQWSKTIWAQDYNKDRVISSENLALMFVDTIIQSYQNFAVRVTMHDMKEVLYLMEENHFQTCSVSECSHRRTSSDDADPMELVYIRSPFHSTPCNGNQRSMNRLNTSFTEEVILTFLAHYGSKQFEAKKLFINIPGLRNAGSQKILILKGKKCRKLLAVKFLQAYHSLSTSESLVNFLNIQLFEIKRLVIQLSRQVSSTILSEERIAKKLEDSAGCKCVKIRAKKFRKAIRGHILEAWGNSQALMKLKGLITEMTENVSALTRGYYASSPITIKKAYMQCFEGYDGPNSEVVLEPYDKPCQPRDDSFPKKVPRLMTPNFSETIDMITFISKFTEQVGVIRKHHDEEQHGHMRAVISYGTSYLKNCSEDRMSGEKYTRRISSTPRRSNDGHVNIVRGRGERGRGRPEVGSQPRTNSTYKIFHEFIPAYDENLDKVFKFFEENDFVEEAKKRKSEYRLSVKMKIDDYQTNSDGDLGLDENFDIKHFYMPDIKWLSIDLIRGQLDSTIPKRYDMRFKLQSIPTKELDEILQHPDFRDILENHKKLLQKDEQGNVVGVQQGYVQRIRYMRHKDVRVFKYNGKKDDHGGSDFLETLSIRINHGKEYTRPSRDGIFQGITEDRTEVTIAINEVELDDPEECDKFVRNIWKFSREFGDKLVPNPSMSQTVVDENNFASCVENEDYLHFQIPSMHSMIPV